MSRSILRAACATIGLTVLAYGAPSGAVAQSQPAATPVAAKVKPTLKLAKSTIKAGQSVKLSGKAPARSVVKIKALRKSVEWKPGISSYQQVEYKWKTVATVRANSRGTWSKAVAPKHPTAYKVNVGKSASKSKTVSVWRWVPLRNLNRSGVFRSLTGGLGFKDMTVGGTTYRNSIDLFGYMDPWNGSGTWQLGKKCTQVKGQAGIVDSYTDFIGSASRLVWRSNGGVAQSTNISWGSLTPFTANVAGAIVWQLGTELPGAYYASYRVAVVNASAYCKN